MLFSKQIKKKNHRLDIATKGFSKAYDYCKKFDVCKLIECIRGDAHDIRIFENGRFDAVTLIYTLHHMSNPKNVLEGVNAISLQKKRLTS